MSEAIKLFGKMIALPDHLNKEETTTLSKDREEDSSSSPNSEEEEQNDSSNSHDKTLKKPDKILPCPRCSSLDTKFCYFNNYNVNQPRHFCKNCQRYWTAGGTMRNVPVGAGRRKNKSSLPSRYRHVVTVPDANSGNPNATVLSFKKPTPFYPAAAYWGCNPWLSPAVTKLGKHRREPEIDATDTVSERNGLRFPKTLRINAEPEEASKSSLWATMGFKSFEKKGEVRAHLTEAAQALHANPAALSRAIRFQESS